MISALFHYIRWSSFQVSRLLLPVLYCVLWCSAIGVWSEWSSCPPSPPPHLEERFLPHSDEMRYMQFVDFCISFLGMAFVTTLRCIIRDLDAVHTHSLFWCFTLYRGTFNGFLISAVPLLVVAENDLYQLRSVLFYTRARTHKHAYIHTYIHTYKRTYVHTHTQIRNWGTPSPLSNGYQGLFPWG
jgi:hypothetical protein